MDGAADACDGARERLLAWLAEIGPRWGLPADACRVHGYLYLAGRAASAAELSDRLGLSEAAVAKALAWLNESDLVEQEKPSFWHTHSDPWVLLTTALEHRRAQELKPALDVLRASRRDAAGDPVLAGQIGKLLDLVEDIAAIDGQARRLSPAMLRGLLGAGGRLARLLGGAAGRRA
jgi:DNA-binding transcriptional regulator GbsR (MarR family)